MKFLYDFLIEFVAAFLGFFFAIVFSRLSEERERKNKLKMIVEGIYNELQDIHKSISTYVTQHVLLRYRIATPTYDALQYAGGVLDLINREYYDEMLTVYSHIKYFNEERNMMSEQDLFTEMKTIEETAQKVLDLMRMEEKHVKNTKR